MRVLHFIDLRERSDESRLALRAALRIRSVTHRVVGFGGKADVQAFLKHVHADAGVGLDGVVAPIGRWPEASLRRLRRLLGARDGRHATRPWADVAQCWNPSLAGLVRLASGHRTPPRVVAVLRSPTRETVGLERRRAEFGLAFANIFALSPAVRSAWAEMASTRRGERMLEQNIRLLSAPVQQGFVPVFNTRETLRAGLGLSPDEFVVTLLGDPPEAADAASFAFLLGLLFTSGVRVTGLARRGAGGMARASRFVRRHGSRWNLNFLDEPTESLLAVSDAAVWLSADQTTGRSESCGPLLIQHAMDMGVPVVAGRAATSLLAMKDRGASLVARSGALSALADRLLMVSSNRDAGALYLSPRSASLFEDDLLALWQEVTNAPVSLPGFPTPTALLEGAA